MLLSVEHAPWYKPWRLLSNDLHVSEGNRVYCVSTVFAPSGVSAMLYHRWEHYDEKQGWQSASRIGFGLSGGRNGGFRGYTYKQNIQSGQWRVKVETENGRTLTVYHFNLDTESADDAHLETESL